MVVVTASTFNELQPRIDAIMRTADPERHVITLDIDATILYNDSNNYCNAEPNYDVHRVYDVARTKGVLVYFVTARIGTPENRMRTVDQLRCMGLDWYNGLAMRGPEHDSAEKVSRFKAEARRQIAESVRKSGKRILLNVGDQFGDVVEGSHHHLQELTRVFDRRYVLFNPTPDQFTEWALKLYETRH